MAQSQEDIFAQQRLAAEVAGYHHYEIVMQPHTSQQDIIHTGDALDAILADPYGTVCRGYIVGFRLQDKATRVFALATDPSDHDLFSSVMALEHVRTVNSTPRDIYSNTPHLQPQIAQRDYQPHQEADFKLSRPRSSPQSSQDDSWVTFRLRTANKTPGFSVQKFTTVLWKICRGYSYPPRAHLIDGLHVGESHSLFDFNARANDPELLRQLSMMDGVEAIFPLV